MKLFILILILPLAGCISKEKKKQVGHQSDVKVVMKVLNSPPVQLDSSFNDFIFKFGSIKNFQKGRIRFPLEYEKMGVISYIPMKLWKHDDLFVTSESVTDISNGIKNIENSNERVFTWINTNTGICKNYFFENTGIWILIKISETKEPQNSQREDFFSFIGNFCKDSVFQKQRINFPLRSIYLNEDYEVVKENITIDKWQYHTIYDSCDSVAIQYYDFKKTFKDTDLRVFMVHGVENGINAQLTFKRIKGIWMLTEYEDYST